MVAKVNDVVWDLDRPFEGDASLKLLKFEDAEGLNLCANFKFRY